jgi:hypothetical protein
VEALKYGMVALQRRGVVYCSSSVLQLLCRNRPEGVVFKARIPNSRNMVVLHEVIGADSGKQQLPTTVCPDHFAQHHHITTIWNSCFKNHTFWLIDPGYGN